MNIKTFDVQIESRLIKLVNTQIFDMDHILFPESDSFFDQFPNDSIPASRRCSNLYQKDPYWKKISAWQLISENLVIWLNV